MIGAAIRARVCLTRADDSFRRGHRQIGLVYFQEAERLLPEVTDPVDFLALNARIDVMVRSHLLPDWRE